MYKSKYYTCEEVDERLLKGYYNDAVSKGYSDTFEQFKTELASIKDIVANSQAIETKADKTYVDTQLAKKVDKVSGKGLSTNDYTTQEKTKLAGVETGANKTIVDEQLSTSSTNPVQNKIVTTKLNEVNLALGKEISTNSNSIDSLVEAMEGVLSDIEQIKENIAGSTTIDLEASALGITSDTTLTEGTLIDVYSGESGGGVLSTEITLNAGQTITSSANNIRALTVFAGNVTGRIKHRVLQVGEINYTADESMTVYVCYRPQGAISTEVKIKDDPRLEEQIAQKADKTYVDTQLATKVDKVSGKGLSTNDFTDAEKTKLSTVESGANRTVVDTSLSNTSSNPVQNKIINAALLGKANAAHSHTFSQILEKPTTLEGYGITDAEVKGASNTALASANSYTDNKIANIINGAPDTLDTLKEIADAMEENESVVAALNQAIGTKATKDEFTAHSTNTDIHINSEERVKWNDSYNKRHSHTNKSILDSTTASYTTGEKTKLSGIETGANKTIIDTELSATSTNPVQNKIVTTKLNTKVDKVSGKGLSANDYTTTDKNLVGTISNKADKVYVDTQLDTKANQTDVNNQFAQVKSLADNAANIRTEDMQYMGVAYDRKGLNDGTYETSSDVLSLPTGSIVDFTNASDGRGNISGEIELHGGETIVIVSDNDTPALLGYSSETQMEVLALPNSDGLCIYKLPGTYYASVYIYGKGAEYCIYKESKIFDLISGAYATVDYLHIIKDSIFDDIHNINDTKADKTDLESKLATKVDKVSGKGLSTNDYTTLEKNLVATIPSKASEKYVNDNIGALAKQRTSFVTPCFSDCDSTHEAKCNRIKLAGGELGFGFKTIFSVTIKIAENLSLLNHTPTYLHIKDLSGNSIGVSMNGVKQMLNLGKYATWFFDSAINTSGEPIVLSLHTTNVASSASDSNLVKIIAHVNLSEGMTGCSVTDENGTYHTDWTPALGINVVNLSAIYPQIKELQKYRMAYATSELPDISTTEHKANIKEIHINQNVMGISLVNSVSIMVASDSAYSGALELRVHDINDNLIASSNNTVNLSQNLGKYVTWYFTPFQLNADVIYKFSVWSSNTSQVMRIHVASGKSEGVTCLDQNNSPHTDYCPAFGINISAIFVDDLRKSIKEVNLALGKEISTNTNRIAYLIGQIGNAISSTETATKGTISISTQGLAPGSNVDISNISPESANLSTGITLKDGQTIEVSTYSAILVEQTQTRAQCVAYGSNISYTATGEEKVYIYNEAFPVNYILRDPSRLDRLEARIAALEAK